MAITGTTDLGAGLLLITVDHDPASIATDAPAGSLIVTTSGAFYRKIDSGSTTNVTKHALKDNLSATTDPTTSNDDTQDYEVNSHWVNTTADRTFVCLDASTGAAIWSNTGLAVDKSIFFAVNGNDFVGSYATVVVGSNAEIHLTFFAPLDVITLNSVKVMLIPQSTGSTLDIDITAEFAAEGELSTANTASDLVTTYNFTADTVTSLDITSLFSGMTAGDYAGVLVDHNSIGQNVDYLGVLIEFD